MIKIKFIVFFNWSKKNNKLNKFSDNYFWINSNSYNKVEMLHHTIMLLVVELIIDRYDYNTNLHLFYLEV
jgi:hypothetical protein